MHFGDGTFKVIDTEVEDDEGEDEAIEQARSFVLDNHWFEVEGD